MAGGWDVRPGAGSVPCGNLWDGCVGCFDAVFGEAVVDTFEDVEFDRDSERYDFADVPSGFRTRPFVVA